MSTCPRVKEEDEKIDEMAIVNFMSGYIIGELEGQPREVVRRVLNGIAETVIEKFSVADSAQQEKLPFFCEVFNKEPCKGKECPDAGRCFKT